MPGRLIRWSVNNRFLVLILTVIITGWGWISLQKIPLDAIPDLSDVQVVIRTSFPGQSPRVVEEQVTYPLTTTMLSVPGASVVRGYSFFGDSYVYVIFDDGTDIYWARARVLEYLNQAASDLPDNVQPRLGPDATGVGWIYNYALVDRTGRHDLAELRSLQDWFLKFELQSVAGVAEVASIGGMVKQYQIIADPEKLRAYGLSLQKLTQAVKAANRDVGGSVIELAEAEYMVRTRGYISRLEDFENIPLQVNAQGTPVLLRDVASIRIGPEMRRGISDLDGQGEVTGGIIVMRYGENALETIKRVKEKIETLRSGLPEGVEIIETYDRSALIKRAVSNLENKLLEEFIVVAVVCILFLFHMRSALVAIITLPLGILMAYIVMRYQGINANIMSLGGIAIAIGAMVDAAIVMIENTHKHLELYKHQHGHMPQGDEHWQTVIRASREVGPALFFSLLIITFSFFPVFTLEAQEGRLFAPLAYTKTYAMAAAAGLSVTLVPVLMGYFIRGKIPSETANPLNRLLIAIYRPLLGSVMRWPATTLLFSLLIILSLAIPLAGISSVLAPAKWPFMLSEYFSGEQSATLKRIENMQASMTAGWKNTFNNTHSLHNLADGLGSEFMPELDEGDLMYMPTTLPGLSVGKARQLLQQTDRLIKQQPEVKQVFGKIGRADTATDPAPLTMIETLIQLKPKSQWRDGMTTRKIIAELDQLVKFPGVTNAWVMPIKTRIDMLATGIKTPVGIKVSGPDIKIIEKVGQEIETALLQVNGTASAYSERVAGGRYIDITPDRLKAARYGLNIEDINLVVSAAVGGINITRTIEGLERYPVNLRFPRERRDDLESLRDLPIVTPNGIQIALGQIADIRITDGAPMLKSENGRLNGWTFVDIQDIDLGSYIHKAQQAVKDKVNVPAGYSITWSGQYEYMLRAQQKLSQVVPLTLVIIFILLYLTFKNSIEALIVMLSLPFALVGGFWMILLLDFNLSVAVGVGFIALAGVAAEFGVVMLVYLDNALKKHQAGQVLTVAILQKAIIEGAVLRIRPKAMTVSVIIAGLIPVFIGEGTGSEVMRRIAAPMIGGMITAPLLSLFVIPVIYLQWKKHRIDK